MHNFYDVHNVRNLFTSTNLFFLNIAVETSGYSSASATFLDEIANHLPKNIAKNRRNVSPYEMSIMDDSLKEFSRKRAKKELIVQEKLKYRNFSPRGIIAKRIEEAKLQWRKEKMNNLGVLQQKVQASIEYIFY